MNARRTPILGDVEYGNGDWNRKYLLKYKVNRPLLHAYEIEFTHPFTKNVLSIHAPLPADMRVILSHITGPKKPLFDDHGYLLVDADMHNLKHLKEFVPMDRLSSPIDVSAGPLCVML